MWSRFLSLFLIFGVLFASTGVPALAHVHDGATVHAMEMLDGHHTEDDGVTEDGSTSPDEPDQFVHHHHCLSGTAVAAPAICGAARIGRADLYPESIRPMTSRDSSPMMEPPAA